LELQVGASLDLALLFAACLEQAGLNPLIVLLQDHALAGFWLSDDHFSTPAIHDPQLLRDRLRGDEIVLVETKALTQPNPAQFHQAIQMAAKHLEEAAPAQFAWALDVKGARGAKVRPLDLGGYTDPVNPVEGSEAHRKYLTIAEAEHKILALSNKQQWLLIGYGKQIMRSALLDHEDLLQEALTAFLSGDRRCPADVPIFVAIRKAMSSIASNKSGGSRTTPFKDSDELSALEGGVSTPAQANLRVYQLLEIFSDQPTTINVLLGLSDHLSEPEIAEKYGLSLGEVKYARKKIKAEVFWLLSCDKTLGFETVHRDERTRLRVKNDY
jgi:hypothetical protein